MSSECASVQVCASFSVRRSLHRFVRGDFLQPDFERTRDLSSRRGDAAQYQQRDSLDLHSANRRDTARQSSLQIEEIRIRRIEQRKELHLKENAGAERSFVSQPTTVPSVAQLNTAVDASPAPRANELIPFCLLGNVARRLKLWSKALMVSSDPAKR